MATPRRSRQNGRFCCFDLSGIGLARSGPADRGPEILPPRRQSDSPPHQAGQDPPTAREAGHEGEAGVKLPGLFGGGGRAGLSRFRAERYAEGVKGSTTRAIAQAGLMAIVLAAVALGVWAGPGPDSHEPEGVEKFTRSSRAVPSPAAVSQLATARHKTLGGDGPSPALPISMALPGEICSRDFVRECGWRTRSTNWTQRPPSRAPPAL